MLDSSWAALPSAAGAGRDRVGDGRRHATNRPRAMLQPTMHHVRRPRRRRTAARVSSVLRRLRRRRARSRLIVGGQSAAAAHASRSSALRSRNSSAGSGSRAASIPNSESSGSNFDVEPLHQRQPSCSEAPAVPPQTHTCVRSRRRAASPGDELARSPPRAGPRSSSRGRGAPGPSRTRRRYPHVEIARRDQRAVAHQRDARDLFVERDVRLQSRPASENVAARACASDTSAAAGVITVRTRMPASGSGCSASAI